MLASAVVLYALRGDDRRGPRFHALLQFQLLGINGAFLTGDLFNLFVFFEVLLIASYALLLYGRSAERVRAGLRYVILNLVGSALFLIALGLIYGVSGTLNMADLSRRVATASGDSVPLLAAAGLLLILVFALKAALLPLSFWLPRAYAAASAPVAALFAIMTKVGIYAILRVCTLVFGAGAGELANLVQPWLWPLALATLAFGALGALAARSLQTLLAYLVLVSAGTLLAAVAIGTPEAIAAALFYLLHSTWVAGGLFLLADLIVRQRGRHGGELVQGAALENPHLLGALFFFGAVAVIGLPRCPVSSASCCCSRRRRRRRCGRCCCSVVSPRWWPSAAPAVPCSGGSAPVPWTAPSWTAAAWRPVSCCSPAACYWWPWPRRCWTTAAPPAPSCMTSRRTGR